MLGYSTGSFKNQANAGGYPPDGRTVSGRAWWHPEIAQRYRREQRPAGTTSAQEVADLLDIPIRAVYRLNHLSATSRVSGRPWWSLQDVIAYQRAMPPSDAVTVNEIAGTLQVTPARVRALARTEWPADGRDPSGRLWWNREPLDQLLGPRRRRALEWALAGSFELLTATLQIELSASATKAHADVVVALQGDVDSCGWFWLETWGSGV